MRKLLGVSTLLALIGGVAVIATISRWDVETSAVDSVTVKASLAVEKFCGICHQVPPPDCEPRHLWPAKIREMYDYVQGDRSWLETYVPPIEESIAYYTDRAPEYLELPDDVTGSPPSPLAFERHLVTLEGIPSPPAVSNVQFVRFSQHGPLELLVSDMRHGVVALWTPSRPTEPAKILARVPHPSRTTVVDLDGDGIRDILVANLGVFWNVDTHEGSVVWLRGHGNYKFESIVLVDGLGRVNEAQAADFDGDGDLDVVVAVFGNLTTGVLVYLENFTEDYLKPDFEPGVIDGRNGTSDVPIVDLNHDGRPDFIALQSQQHEEVIAFLNTGGGRFKSETIYAAPHPRWGSTGIKLVDMDGDGDVDVLFNHGDSVQIPPVLRPYHGFGWLENKGRFPFTYHRLAHFPGAQTAQTADLDGDGDLDIVSSAFIPTFNPHWPSARFLETVIWLEQTEPGQYQRYVLETRTAFHPCLDLGDYDDDGDIDIAMGNFVMFADKQNSWKSCVTLWENRSVHTVSDQP